MVSCAVTLSLTNNAFSHVVPKIRLGLPSAGEMQRPCIATSTLTVMDAGAVGTDAHTLWGVIVMEAALPSLPDPTCATSTCIKM